MRSIACARFGDCIKNFRSTALEKKLLDAAALDAVDEEVLALIDSAVAEALLAPPPVPEQVMEDVYVTY